MGHTFLVFPLLAADNRSAERPRIGALRFACPLCSHLRDLKDYKELPFGRLVADEHRQNSCTAILFVSENMIGCDCHWS